MATKSKVALLVEFKKLDNFTQEIDEYVDAQAKNLSEGLQEEFVMFFNQPSFDPSLEFMARWESNEELKNAMSNVFNKVADIMESVILTLRALAE